MGIDSLPSIFDCKEYTDRRWPPYHDTRIHTFRAHMPTLFSFAYTPTGRVSKYWCSITFNYPHPSPARINRWEHERPKLRPGYRWSRVYVYQKYVSCKG